MLEQPDNHFDVLVTDQTMPGQSGSALAQTLATEQPDLPVIIISGKLDHEIREQLKNTGVIAILDKPFNRRTLLDALALLPIDLHTNNPGDS